MSVHVLGAQVPLVGAGSIFVPRIIGNGWFFEDSGKIINDGYSKFRTKAFKLVRNDADIVILPHSSVDEIGSLPCEVANPTIAHAHNLLGKYTKMDLILRSDLHFRMIQTKLTPKLGSLTGPMQDEVRWATTHAIPDCEDKWIKVKPYHTILDIVASTSAHQRWLEASVQFTENIFVTVVTMRLFPTWTHGILSWLLPSNYRSARYIQKAKNLFVPEIERRKALLSRGELDEATSNTLLSWMIQCAEGADKDSHHLAHLEIVISLAAIHTSQMNIVHVLYDLAVRPHYIEELREEIRNVVASKGGRWDKTSYSQLRKLDSFMKESQRFGPPSAFIPSCHGARLPKGTHVAMPVQAIQNDPAITENPDIFDGLRYYRLRQESGEANRHQFAMMEKTQLHFGHGRAACPGRFLGSLEIKMIIVHFIMSYDFKPAGEQRPANLRAHEFIFPNPEGELLICRKNKPESPLHS
ncbi:cytochrome P450 [Xylaria cf. heliscus]|nr:cytochrome P450 [Xylaria cf. heliscus]